MESERDYMYNGRRLLQGTGGGRNYQEKYSQNTLIYLNDGVFMKPCFFLQWKHPGVNNLKNQHIFGSIIFTFSTLVFTFGFRGTKFEKDHSSYCLGREGWEDPCTNVQQKAELGACWVSNSPCSLCKSAVLPSDSCLVHSQLPQNCFDFLAPPSSWLVDT